MSPTRPHILLSFEKWCDLNPSVGLSSSYENFAGPLEASGFANFTVFHPDEFVYRHGESVDLALINACQAINPSLLFMLWYPGGYERFNPCLETLYAIRAELGVPIVIFWADSQEDHFFRLSEVLLPFIDYTVDGLSCRPEMPHPDKHLQLCHPKDPRVYFQGQGERDIEVLFPGSTNNRPKRKQIIDFLIANGVDVQKIGGQREQKLSTNNYAAFLRRAKMIINICDYPTRSINGRLLEGTMSGALLFEDDNSDAGRWFKQGQECEIYHNKEELLKKIRYYREHVAEAEAIAARGARVSHETFDGRLFWRTIIEAVQSAPRFDPREALLALAICSYNSGALADAVRRLVELRRRHPGYGSALYWLGKCLLEAGLNEQAERFLSDYIGAHPGEIHAYRLLQELYLKISAHEAALSITKKAYSQFASSMVGDELAVLAQMLVSVNCFHELVVVEHQASRYNIYSPALYLAMAKALAATGNPADARTVLELARKQGEGDKALLVEIFSLCQSLGDLRDAIETAWLSTRPPCKNLWELYYHLYIKELKGEIREVVEIIDSYEKLGYIDTHLNLKREKLRLKLAQFASTLDTNRVLEELQK